MSIRIRFEKSEICVEAHPAEGNRDRTVDYDTTDGSWAQLTYDSLRTQDGAILAYICPDGCWLTEDDGRHWSDVIIELVA